MESGETRGVRGRVKAAIAYALAGTRADALIGMLSDSARPPVAIGYHRVVEDFPSEARRAIPAMLTSRQMLERQLDWIGRRFRFVTLDELGARLERGALTEPVAAVTFDDGYRDVYFHALPFLKKKGIPAAVFVVTDLVDTAQLQIHDRLYLLLARAFAKWPAPSRGLRALLTALEIPLIGLERLEQLAPEAVLALALLLRSLSRDDVGRLMDALEADVGPDETAAEGLLPLTWDMLAEMQRAGVNVGSHTRSHAWLTQENPDRMVGEIIESRKAIEARLGTPVRHFAYPDGRFTTATARAVAAAGYDFAYTTCTHRDRRYPLLTISRTMLWEHSCVDALGRFSPAIMSCQVHGVFNLVRGCQQDHAG
jgi:peptidoglycan/xylan/chitin deacetylase (PgdA/CDA1 family)